MRKTLLIGWLWGFTLLVSVSPALAASLTDIIQALQAPFRAETAPEYRIYDYSAEFFQESRIASLDRLQRARGRVVVAFDYRQPGQVPTVRFRWQYEQPTTQEIVSDGDTLWVYLPENNQVILSDIELVNEARQNDPMTFLTGLGNLSRDFQITWAEPNQDVEGNYILDLRPRKTSALINRLVIVVDRWAVESFINRDQESELPQSAPSPGQFFAPVEGRPGVWFPILSTTVFDPNGNSTLIEFSDLRVNQGVSPGRFEFIMPAGVQVVRPSGQGMGF